jgi:DNA-binding LacI/PurR family transcriptional regulator
MSASLAIRGSEESNRVSPETRRRILEVARELDYRPDARALALRRQRTNIIGYYAGYGIINVRIPFFTETIGGLQQGCELLGKNLLLHSPSLDAESDEVFRELIDGKVDGLVVSMPATDPMAKRLAETHLPVVAVADPIPGIPSVVVDDFGGGRLIAEHLAELGHRRAVFGIRGGAPTSAKLRQQGFMQAAAERGLDVTVRPLGTETEPCSFVLRARELGASVIVAWNDADAYRVLEACHTTGIRLPEDMALVGFDGCPGPYHHSFPLTTVHAPWAEVAQQAVFVLDRMLRNEPYALETVLPVQFVPGATT